MASLLGYVVGAVCCGVFTAWIARGKGRSLAEGMLLGTLLVLLGLAIEFYLPADAEQIAMRKKGQR